MQSLIFKVMPELFTKGGKPIIKGTRISVDFILELVASGASVGDIVRTYPHLTLEGVKEAIQYASAHLR
ncbi:MAG: DUF433 domain-containing protein [Saprospiraceae bacterium]